MLKVRRDLVVSLLGGFRVHLQSMDMSGTMVCTATKCQQQHDMHQGTACAQVLFLSK